MGKDFSEFLMVIGAIMTCVIAPVFVFFLRSIYKVLYHMIQPLPFAVHQPTRFWHRSNTSVFSVDCTRVCSSYAIKSLCCRETGRVMLPRVRQSTTSDNIHLPPCGEVVGTFSTAVLSISSEGIGVAL